MANGNGMRRFKTDYAGAFPGFAKTKQGAINAAHKHLVSDGYTSCTIIDLHQSTDVAYVYFEDPKTRTKIVTESVTGLRRVPR